RTTADDSEGNTAELFEPDDVFHAILPDRRVRGFAASDRAGRACQTSPGDSIALPAPRLRTSRHAGLDPRARARSLPSLASILVGDSGRVLRVDDQQAVPHGVAKSKLAEHQTQRRLELRRLEVEVDR